MKKSVLLSLVMIIFISVFSHSPAFAQLEDFGQTQCNCSCFRGKPRSECKSYLVLETGFMVRNGNSKADRYDDYESIFIANVGKMFNISNRSAIGGTIDIAPGNNGMDIGLGPRYRYWMSKGMALDLSPRLIMLRTGDYDLDRVGFQFDASISVGELFSVDTHYRSVRYKPNFSLVNWAPGSFGTVYKPKSEGFYFGFSGHSYAAPVVPAMVLMFALLFDHDQIIQFNY